MDTLSISRFVPLTLLVACAPLAAQTPTVDTTTVTITYTGSTFPSPQSVHVSNASNVSARISANIQADGSVASSAGNTPGVFVQNVTPTSTTTASVNIGVDSNVLGALARRGATTYTGAQLLISATGCIDCVAVAMTMSITNGGSVNITYNGAPIPSSGLQLSAPQFGSTSAQLTLTSTNPSAFTASSNVTWLTVSPVSGNLQGSQILTLSLFANGLPNGPNSATVTVNAGGITTTVPIVFNVGTSSGLTLSPNPMNFQYSTSTGSFPTGQAQYLTISGAHGTAMYSATASSSPAWLGVGNLGGTFVSGLQVQSPLQVSVNVAVLNLQVAATYQGTVTITTSDGLTSTLTVNLTISATGGTGTGSLTFNVPFVGGSAPTQQVAISGTGFFSAFASTSSCGQGWLQVAPNSGQLSGIATPLTVSVIPGSLSAGTCTGTISISTTGLLSTGTSSQTISVTMVIGGSTVSGPVASPASLTFNLQSGSTQSQQQTFIVNGNGTSYSAQAFGNLTVSPPNGTTPAVVTVTVSPGNSSGTIVVTSSLGSQNVTVGVNTLAGNVLTATPGSLSFLNQMGTIGTTNVSINASQDSNGTHLTFSVVSAPSFVAYATTSTTTPSAIGVGINTSQLAPGINTGNLVITSPGAANTLTIPVTVLAPGSTPSGLVATPNPANVSGTPFGAAVTQTISLTGLSGTFISASPSSTGNWLAVTQSSSTSPATLTITANPLNLAAGTYAGSVTVTGNGTTLLTIPVNFTVSTTGTGTTVLTVSPTTLTFNYRTGDTAPAPQGVSLSTNTGAAVNFTAVASASWITVSPPAGSTPSTLNIGLNTAALSSGTQTGTVTINAQGATSQTVTVTANVTAPPVLTLNTTSAGFSYRMGDPAPAAQSIQVNSSGAALPFSILVSGAPWLIVTPTSYITPASLMLAVAPTALSGLSAGQYSGSVTINAPGASLAFAVTLSVATSIPTVNLTVWRPANGTWYVNPINAAPFIQQWGLPGDIPLAGDFNHNGTPDYVVWRPSNGTWYVTLSGTSTVITKQLGISGDVPVSGDFDGDGITDFAVWRPSNGTWYIIPSSNPSSQIVKQWGLPGDIPVVADFDIDGKADYVVWRPAEGNWYITLSGTGTTLVKQWGLPGDVPVAVDYDGDGKADFAVWRPAEGNWYILPSSSPSAVVVRQWGLPGDIPVPRDYDCDGKADLGVWRPSNGTWYIILSTNSAASLTIQWGLVNDEPIYRPPGS